MPWIRLDDQFPDHPKVVEAGPLAAWLYVCGIGYCNRLLTDGFIPAGQVRKLADVDNVAELVARLVAVKLWDTAEGGYRVHDYLDYQPSREKAMELREKRAEAGSRGGKQKASNLLERGQDVASDVLVANGKQNSTPYPSRTHPVPLPRPEPKPAPESGVRAAPKRADARPALPPIDVLVEQLRAWAETKGVRDILQDEVERFHDYCLSGKNGKPVVYADYAAACRKWITNPSFDHSSKSRSPVALNGQRSNAAVKEERMFSNVLAWTPPERSSR